MLNFEPLLLYSGVGDASFVILFCAGSPRGQITIVAEEVQDSKFTVTMRLAASKLDKKDFFGKVGFIPWHLSAGRGA